MVRPTRRPGTLEELIRILPEGIGIVPLLLNFKAGTIAEFQKSIPQYERFVAELAEQDVDLIIAAGAPPFMLLGFEGEARLIRQWEKKYKTQIVTDPPMQVAGPRALGIKKFIGASYSAVQNKIVLDYMAQAGMKAVAMCPSTFPSTKSPKFPRKCSTRMSKSSFGSIPARTASTSRVAAGKRHASSKCSKRTFRSRSCTPRSARHGKFTSVSACAKPSLASDGCSRNCHSKAPDCHSPAILDELNLQMSAMKPGIGRLSAVAFAGLIALSGPQVRSEVANEYFAGKQISLFIGTTAGGGYDLYARTLARHIARHIPGHPSIIAKNMPGAGGLTLANYLYNRAASDGSELATVQNGLPSRSSFRPCQRTARTHCSTQRSSVGSAASCRPCS